MKKKERKKERKKGRKKKVKNRQVALRSKKEKYIWGVGRGDDHGIE